MFLNIIAGKKKGKGKLSDIEFLSIKEFNSKLVENQSSRTTTGVLATLTASSGKDLYLAGAKVSVKRTAVGSGDTAITVQLQVNAVVQETFVCHLASNGLADLHEVYEFKLKGVKVLTTEVIKLQLTAIGSETTVAGMIQGFEEDTGKTPQIPPI